MVVNVKDPFGRPVDLRGWGASARVFYQTKLAEDAFAEDLSWLLRAGEEKTYPIVGDLITVEGCDQETVAVIAVAECTEAFVSRESSGGFDHAVGASLSVLRGAATAEVLVETFLADETSDLSYELDGEAYSGDLHQQPDGRWWTGVEHSDDSELLAVVPETDERLASSRVRVAMNESITAAPGKFWVQVVLTGPSSEKSTLPRSTKGFCLRVLA